MYPWERFMDTVGESAVKAASEAVANVAVQQFKDQMTSAINGMHVIIMTASMSNNSAQDLLPLPQVPPLLQNPLQPSNSPTHLPRSNQE